MALLLIIFVFVSTNRAQVVIPSPAVDSAKLSTGASADGISEQAIKSNEDDIRQKLQSTQNGAKKPLANAATEEAHDKLIANSGPKAVPKAVPKTVPKGISKGSTADSNTEELFDAAVEFNSIMTLSPVVIFSKTYCGYSKALKKLLTSEYELIPNPTVVELDKHTHGRELQEYIAIKTGRRTVPNLFVGGVSRGGSDDIKKLHEDGSLSNYLNQWGNKQIKVSKVSAPSNS